MFILESEENYKKIKIKSTHIFNAMIAISNFLIQKMFQPVSQAYIVYMYLLL